MFIFIALSCLRRLLIAILYHFYTIFCDRVNQFAKYINGSDTLFQKPLARTYCSTRVMRKTEDDSLVNFQPLTGGCVPRYAGMATMMRLPFLELSSLRASNVVDVGLIGIPWVQTAASNLYYFYISLCISCS
jgi:hypothetical protein